jgi:hypothetical protein
MKQRPGRRALTNRDREQDDGPDLERKLVLGDRVPGFDSLLALSVT